MLIDPLASVRHAVKKARAAERDRDDHIRHAFDAARRRDGGYTVDDIAQAAGLSRARIYQLVDETKDA